MYIPYRYFLSALSLLAALAVSCQFDTVGYDPWGPPDPDAGLLDASPEASVGADGGGECVNGQQRCYGADVELCAEGQWTVDTTCPWGCNFSNPPYPYCGNPYWAESVDPDTDVSAEIWVAAVGTTIIDTDARTITFNGTPIAASFADRVHYRPDGQPPVTIFGFERITIPVGATVVVQGAAALALVANDTIVISGELLAQGQSNGTAGPGGYPGGTTGNSGSGPGFGGAGNGSDGALVRAGGGGGGHAAAGGDGATVDPLLGNVIVGGTGGEFVSHATLDGTLVGGSGGGATAVDLLDGGSSPGGGGGGAVMLAARTAVEILATGVVNVGGGGGATGAAGGGGGAGGMVLIQSAGCVVLGVVAANGGGGGDLGNGGPGEPGQASATPAAGGGDHGGAGGAGSSLAGSTGSTDDANGGGGGGAAGVIRMDCVQPPDIDMGVLSPGEGSGALLLNDFPTT